MPAGQALTTPHRLRPAFGAERAYDPLEIVGDCHDAGSVPYRLINDACRIELSGDSLRKHRPGD